MPHFASSDSDYLFLNDCFDDEDERAFAKPRRKATPAADVAEEVPDLSQEELRQLQQEGEQDAWANAMDRAAELHW